MADFETGSGIATIDAQGQIVHTKNYEGCTSCFIIRKDNRIYTANYHEGKVTILEETESGIEIKHQVHVQDKAGCHQILFHENTLLVPCLFLDQIKIYDQTLNEMGHIDFPKGSGPRHAIFTKDHSHLYVVSELSNEFFVLETKNWTITDQITILENGLKNVKDTAAIRMSENEKYIYISTRTQDVLSVVEMNNHKPTLKQVISCNGQHPRDILLLEPYLIVANRFTNSVHSFAINEDGTIGKEIDRITVPEVVALINKNA